ncbi:BatD family protein [Gracilimonas tropica]|uniref:BatD family protein n=1 Tax=Gracilimonas tropica TaxID=454600 RepID=UPI000376B900|nr:BatD family protein [Gracilimonas tropica]
MKKIGNQSQFLLLIFIFLMLPFTGFTQSLQVDLSMSETNVYSGEQVSVKLAISGTSIGSINQPQPPEIDGLRWLRGSTSRGTNYVLKNNTPTITYTFGYLFIAQDPGSYTIPPFEVEIDGEKYQSNTLNFTVLDPATIDEEEAQRAPDIYVRLEPATESPVVGEQVIVDVVLYFKNGIEISSYQPTPGWKAEGFWKEELQYPQRAQATSTLVNGIRYQKARLIQYALFPTKSGELTLSPFELTLSVRQQRRSDPFGFGFGQERQKVQSIPVTINAQPLPALKNAAFIGAVGDFKITREVSPKKAMVGESIEITTKISGTGNIPLINKPEYEFPEALEKYNPQQNSTINRQNREVSGTKVFTDVLIARNEGTFTIPAAKLAYFDPSTDSYVIEEVPAIKITAERDPNSSVAEVRDLKLEIEPISGLAQWSNTTSRPLYQKGWVWLMLMLPLFITAGAYGYKKYSDRMRTDTAFARSRTASKKAEKTLSELNKSADIKQGYHLIEKALIQFITDKLNLPPAGLSHSDIIEQVETLGNAETTASLKQLLTKCETIAYAPNVNQESLQTDLEKTKQLIKELEKQV